MHPNQIARFVRKWFAELGSSPPVYGRASALLSDLIESHPLDAWERILWLVKHAKTPDALGLIGAGPLEDLLSKHGKVIIDQVEAAAVADSRFANCLAAVWGWSRMEPSVYERVQHVVKSTSKTWSKCFAIPPHNQPCKRF